MDVLHGKLTFDPIVGEKLYGNQRKHGSISSERDLMFAILADAIDCYWKFAGARDGRGIKLFQDARRWLFDDDESETFSFVNVCDTLSFDPAYIRRGVVQAEQRLREAQRAEKRPQGVRPKKIKPNLKSTTRWRVRTRTVGG
ncbi:MAG: hypothetical protein ACREPG_11150 [Candidatus Binatia bacterium]